MLWLSVILIKIKSFIQSSVNITIRPFIPSAPKKKVNLTFVPL